MPSYLVECYVPNFRSRELPETAARARDAAQQDREPELVARRQAPRLEREGRDLSEPDRRRDGRLRRGAEAPDRRRVAARLGPGQPPLTGLYLNGRR
jgi:hypothetical protein